MYSCDTFAVCASLRPDKRNLLAKNSDRPVGECQPLIYFPAADHHSDEFIQCTYIKIPQVSHTYAMLGSKPYWIYGFEMGINEFGLAIGNEAEWSRCDAESDDGLLGMDMLRLALERTKTCREAITLISQLLQTYGQRGNARNRNGSEYYENSFLLTDPNEVWVMETAGRGYVAKQIHSWKAISNCYTLGKDYDLISNGLEQLAKERRFLAPAELFDFAKAFSKRANGAATRLRRQCKLIEQSPKPMDDVSVKKVLRDHYHGDIMEPRFGALTGTFASICMHASTIRGSQTAASVLFCWDKTLGVVARYAPSVPCCSVYLPVYLTGRPLPKPMEYASGTFCKESLWWNVERLMVALNIDEERFAPAAHNALRALEERLEEQAKNTEQKAAELIIRGEREAAADMLDALTQHSVKELMETVDRLYQEITMAVRADGGLYGGRTEFIRDYIDFAEIPLL